MENKTKDNFSVAVVIPAYNCQKYLSRSLDSVFAQTRLPDEIIVVDDGSTDKTSEIAAGFGDKINYIYQENAGASAARNVGINAAKSKWIAFLDADDEWLPEYLESQLEILTRNPELVWTTGNYYTRFDSQDKYAQWNSTSKMTRLLKGKDCFGDFFLMLANDINGHTNTTIIRKDILIEAGLFSIEQKKTEDLDLWWRVAYLNPKIGFLVKPLAFYYLGVNHSITSNISDSSFYSRLLLRHIELAKKTEHYESFRKFLAFRISRWSRSMLFDQRCDSVRCFVSDFKEFLPLYKRIFFWFVTISPSLTRWVMLTISMIVRKSNIRNRVVQLPKRGCKHSA